MSRDRRIEAFDRLFRDHAVPLLRFLTYQTGDPALAEDIVADTFERALKARGGWRGRSNPRTWLYAIALNRLRDVARRRQVEARALERVRALPDAKPDEADWLSDREALADAVRQLPEAQRTLVALRFGADLKLQEIATVLGANQSTVESRLYAALERLRETLE